MIDVIIAQDIISLLKAGALLAVFELPLVLGSYQTRNVTEMLIFARGGVLSKLGHL